MTRLAEIDAPEKKQAFGDRSKEALSDLCFKQWTAISARRTIDLGERLRVLSARARTPMPSKCAAEWHGRRRASHSSRKSQCAMFHNAPPVKEGMNRRDLSHHEAQQLIPKLRFPWK